MTWTRLGLVHDYLQAEALKARLYENGIEARVVSQTHTGSTAGEPALRLGGVSAVSSGHPILVQEADLERARQVAAEFERYNRLAVKDQDDQDSHEPPFRADRRRFLLFGFAGSLFLPFVGAPLALYWFVRYLRRGGPILRFDILAALSLTLFIIALHFYLYL